MARKNVPLAPAMGAESEVGRVIRALERALGAQYQAKRSEAEVSRLAELAQQLAARSAELHAQRARSNVIMFPESRIVRRPKERVQPTARKARAPMRDAYDIEIRKLAEMTADRRAQCGLPPMPLDEIEKALREA